MMQKTHRLTAVATTLPHLKLIIVVAQWFLVRFGNLSLSDGFHS